VQPSRHPLHLAAVAATLALSLSLSVPTPSAAAPAPSIRLEVDASRAAQRLFQAKLTLPVAAGPLTLAYPKWLPGQHGPVGPINDVVGMVIRGGGKRLSWTRDPVDMYQLRLDIPKGVDAITIEVDFAAPAGGPAAFGEGPSGTAALALVSWGSFMFYPVGARPDDLIVAATLRLPAGWQAGTALPLDKAAGVNLTYRPASLTTLVDSPVLIGAHTREVKLGDQPPARIFAAADGASALDFGADVVDRYRALMAEAGALFGARHFRSYTFLVTLSDNVRSFGLEHHESSDNRSQEMLFVDEDKRRADATLMPHELVHSWNGKYRRPANMAVGRFDEPMHGELLWVYEGLTSYLGWLLAARSGLLSADDTRGLLAQTAAGMDLPGGRSWRPLVDTTVAAQVLYAAPRAWRHARGAASTSTRRVSSCGSRSTRSSAARARARRASTTSASCSTAARTAGPRSSLTRWTTS
jgi:predicted metalloprotease with PDZ domain